MSDLKQKPRKGIYLLPNLLTTGALFAGFYAIIASTADRFEHAAIAIVVAMLLDGFDGRVARMTHTSTEFGSEYDSLSDMVSFGVAPALVMYFWALVHFQGYPVMSKLGWLAAFFYTAAAALRLARFNTHVGEEGNKKFFQGLPSPAAAAVMVGFIWVCHDLGLSRADFAIPALIITVLLGAAMVSNFSYYSFKDISPGERVPFYALLAIVMGFILASLDTPKLFFALFAIYAFSGPVTHFLRLRRKRQQRALAEKDDQGIIQEVKTKDDPKMDAKKQNES
jgi:CDP-diacylglycerol--serine O-phosphatidyltransferase